MGIRFRYPADDITGSKKELTAAIHGDERGCRWPRAGCGSERSHALQEVQPVLASGRHGPARGPSSGNSSLARDRRLVREQATAKVLPEQFTAILELLDPAVVDDIADELRVGRRVDRERTRKAIECPAKILAA
jgi:hypothetical protein